MKSDRGVDSQIEVWRDSKTPYTMELTDRKLYTLSSLNTNKTNKN